MDDTLTLSDGKLYYLEAVFETEPRLRPERRALIEADLAKGDASLIRQYMTLQAKLYIQTAEAFEDMMDAPVGDTLERWAKSKRDAIGQPSSGDTRRSLGNSKKPLSEAIEIMKERLGIESWSSSLGLDDESWRESLDQDHKGRRRYLDDRPPSESWGDRDYNQGSGGRDRR